jgi:hypothetical protein
MKNKYFLLIGVGVLSGVVNAILSLNLFPQSTIDTRLLFSMFLGGIPYGIITGIYFITVAPLAKKYLRLFWWVIASTISYIAGAWITYDLVLRWMNSGSYVAGYGKDQYGGMFLFGGAVGAFILSVAFHFIFHKMKVWDHITVIVAGAVVAFLIEITIPIFKSFGGFLFYPMLYIGWQTIITTLLGLLLFTQSDFIKKYLFLIGIGFLSGIVNVIPPYISEGSSFLFALYLAGIPYGIITGIYFITVAPLARKYLRLFLWTVASTISYIVGVQVALRATAGEWHLTPEFALSGFLGALVLSVAFHFIFKKMKIWQHAMVVIAGAVTVCLAFSVFPEPDANFYFSMYVGWQTVVTTLLGVTLFTQDDSVKLASE